MAPVRRRPGGETNADRIRDLIENGNSTDRKNALDDLITLFSKRGQSANQPLLEADAFHKILEALFRCARDERQSYLKPKRNSKPDERLAKTAEALRAAIGYKASGLKRKMIRAIIDHITQTLPGRSGEDYIAPLLKDYIRALLALLNNSANVEQISALDGEGWIICVDFLVEVASRLMEGSERESASLSRASPAPSLTFSTGRSGTASTQRFSEKVPSTTLGYVLESILALVSATNAPLQQRVEQISSILIQALRLRQITSTAVLQPAFTALNFIISRCQGDDLSLIHGITRDVVPLMVHWWQPRSSTSQDESRNSFRDEILRVIFGLQLHIEHLAGNPAESGFLEQIERLLNALWMEYSKRDDRSRLQINDLTFSFLHTDYFNNSVFGLRPFAIEAERRWAIVEVIARLESIYSRASKRSTHKVPEKDEQPRKRRRVEENAGQLGDRLGSRDPGVRLTALQVLPFLVRRCEPSREELAGSLTDLAAFITNKLSTVSSWAMIACASYTLCDGAKEAALSSLWKQICQITIRAISVPGMSRAACALLHSILEAGLVDYHDVSDDINAMIIAADISGPALLVDSSLILMLHLLHLRNTMLPSANQATSNHIMRWVFSRWKPADLNSASVSSVHTPPLDLVNLLKACLGLSAVKVTRQLSYFGGLISQSWKSYGESEDMMRYLLLLPSSRPSLGVRRTCQHSSSDATTPQFSDPATSNLTKKVIIELLHPILDETLQVSETWTAKRGEGATRITADRVHAFASLSITVAMLVPALGSVNSSLSRDIEVALFRLVGNAFKAMVDSEQSQALFEICLEAVSAYIPAITTAELELLHQENPALLKYLSELSLALQDQQLRQSSGHSPDEMDLDDDFEPQTSQSIRLAKAASSPRQDVQLSLSPEAFHLGIAHRLFLLSAIHHDQGQIGLVPEPFIDQLAGLPSDDFLFCREVMNEVFTSDLVITPDDALKITETIGIIIGETEHSCCETALGTCLDIMENFISIWSDDKLELSTKIGDIYTFFLKHALPRNFLSPKAQTWLSRLMYRLLEVNPSYAASLGLVPELPSCRSSLLSLLEHGNMLVKHYIALVLPRIFGLFVLKTHDDIFCDILDKLPSDPAKIEGIAIRLFAFAEMACKWPTLLRRCIYHIFETPARLANCSAYATCCLAKVAESLLLDSPRELFRLFTPQLLYTWLENDSIQDIAFEIFGFSSLDELLSQAQTEAAALMVMRGQESEALTMAECLGLTPAAMIQQSFSRVIACGLAHDISPLTDKQQSSAESRVRKILGKEPFAEAIYLNFADIVATLLDLIDQEDPIEKYFAKEPSFRYAAEIMAEIKGFGHSPASLPANQQPMFRAKFLTRELVHLCSRTEYEVDTMWSPTLVVSIARKLLNTIHASLGPLHACSVIRKLRVLICLAGPQATSSYPLEMLLHSIRPFIQEAECADDALGLTRYLVTRGEGYLTRSPSFFAGYSLSTLASLRMFLESSQASTTQESQFKATMNKAQQFHNWFSGYLVQYESPAFKGVAQRSAFKSITQSAAQIRASGNAEKGTHESTLLLDILKDGERDDRLLDDSARDLALGMLCGDFRVPGAGHKDIVETDRDAVYYNSVIWKSCKAHSLSKDYLTWAGRAVGRYFAASGEVDGELLRESRLTQYSKDAGGNTSSEQGLLRLLQTLTMNGDSTTAGLAESAIRTIVTTAVSQEDKELLLACQNSLSEALFGSSDWSQYRTPPSDLQMSETEADRRVFDAKSIELSSWSQDLAVYLALRIPDDVVLSVLAPILRKVKGFAEQAFPFVVHLVLLFQFDQQQAVKRSLAEAAKQWLASTTAAARENVKLLVNTILYLQTQPLPIEESIAERSQWLNIDLSLVAAAASQCGLFKIALQFAETALTGPARGSRRSSISKGLDLVDSADLLLEIFENIDDPDAYYGLPQSASLHSVLARLEHEKDGIKTLAFRGAQYDSHLRRHEDAAAKDSQSLVQALSNLGLAGLSNSLLQTQQSSDVTPASLDSAFNTARRLGVWNLPAPHTVESHAVTVYRAYQSIHQATELETVQRAVYEGLGSTMKYLTTHSLNATSLRSHLGALAALTELDDVMNITDFSELENMLSKFEERSKWMMSGRYDDVSHILSCRESTLSTISQQGHLRGSMKVSPAEARLVEIKGMLLSSGVYRFHHAMQESLSLSTSLADLIEPSEALGLKVDAAIKVEISNSLWDHDEMIPSIRMLQSVDKESALKNQTVSVSRSELLSKIGHRVSVARLESADSIQKTYLEPALRELKGASKGKEAGQVFHQFAMFCDEQLQNADGQEDLARLQNLKKGKSDEVEQLKSLLAGAKDAQTKQRYTSHLSKAKQWLTLDEQELRRVEQTRNEFNRLSLENYLLSLIASDDHNNDALRFTALWLERSEEDSTNEAVKKLIGEVPTRKFAPLMNQLSSRLQDSRQSDHMTLFQRVLINLVYSICCDHPYHGMYQIWSGAKSRTNTKDEVAVLRHEAHVRVANQLAKTSQGNVARIWQNIDRTSKFYKELASEKDANRYKSGQKIDMKDSPAGKALMQCLLKYPIPPPTMQLELAADKDYTGVPIMAKLDHKMNIAAGVSAPKIITAIGSDGKKYKQLVKGGNDDLRQDAIMEQVFAAVSSLLKLHRATRQRNLGIRTYKVLPLTSSTGLIEFVSDTEALHDYLMPAHERFYPKDLKSTQCRREIHGAQNKTVEVRISTYRKVAERFHPVMRYFFLENFPDPDDWFVKRLAYTRATAAVSMLGHVLGLGDRHGHNILLDTKTGEVVHIDLGVAFEMGRVLPVPELVPFRLTRDIVDGMGITETEGVFRRCCEFTLDALREETYSIMTILDVLRYDPLYSWSISPVRLAKLQDVRRVDDTEAGVEQSEVENRKVVNEPSEADRALEVVRKKLSKTLSVTATVHDLINQATDERNLAVLYSGWAAYA